MPFAAETREMAASLLALGLDPDRCTLFVQSHRPEHTELAWLLATVTPVSWVERTPTYKEKKRRPARRREPRPAHLPGAPGRGHRHLQGVPVPVGKDQAAHLELSREIVRAFNHRYGETFPEPQAVFTEAPVVLGTDGVRKMSKSLGNAIEILARAGRDPEAGHVDGHRHAADPAHRSGPPEVCNVCQLHRFFGDDYEEIWDGERTARTGCVDTKKLLAERIIRHYAPARERYLELMAHPAEIDGSSRRAPTASSPGRGDDGRGPRADGAALGSPSAAQRSAARTEGAVR